VRRRERGALAAAVLFAAGFPVSAADGPVRVGSKKFTESYVLGEIMTRALAGAGVRAEHRPGMGGTLILWQALRSGAIDAYPEYTGTIAEEIVRTPGAASVPALRPRLGALGIGITDPLGFNNTYALVMRRDRARALGIASIGDLRGHPGLSAGFTHEFLDRRDGWAPLARRYALALRKVRGIDHALGYEALASGAIDVKDAYSTDARIAEDDLVVLRDDLGFFPRYDAVILYREAIEPRAVAALRGLSGRIDGTEMTRLNALAERTRDYGRAADAFLGGRPAPRPSTARNIARWTWRHVELVGISVALAVLAGIPLGIAASGRGWGARAILALAGVVQTVPALALLALLVPVPFLGISPTTAVVALFLYSLLPIVRNTAAGLQDIPGWLKESAEALGLPPAARLLRIHLPMASRTILAGIKTSAVIAVGTATLAALIGAGGLGEPILSGLNLNDHATILEGAVPAAILALVVEGLFVLADRVLIPRGLRLPPAGE
jgi:osmoprotectant transport system permease protein